MISYLDLVEDALGQLRAAKTEAARANASCNLVDLGRVYAGDAGSQPTFVEPASWVTRIFGDIDLRTGLVRK